MPVLIHYHGRMVAVAGATRFYLLPDVERLPPLDPLVRMACLMAAYAHAVRRAEVPGPYSDSGAERYAREALVPHDEFSHLEVAGWSDAALARHFGVPIEQLGLKRQDRRT